ncbi:MAG: hypothetical protein JXA57_02965 [Armatimonadetes bacterium]|nr:hypothetical protein [Armatimonadota bacterium]
MTRYLVACILSSMCLLGGCSRTPDEVPVLFSPPVTSVTVLERDLKGRDDSRWPQGPDEWGATRGAPIGAEYSLDTTGPGRPYAIRSVDGSRQQKALVLAIADRTGEEIARTEALPVPSDARDWLLLAHWDPTGSHVAITFLERGNDWRHVVGVLDLPSGEVRQILRDDGSQWERALWIGDRLILVYRDKIVGVDAEDGRVKQLYPETGTDHRRDIGLALASPDGTFLLFDRRPVGGPDQSGIYSLDLITGTYGQTIGEQSDTYTLSLLHWSSEKTLVFDRVNNSGTWDVLEATFQ